MRRNARTIAPVLLVVAVLGVVLWVNAGDINPPAGPVGPTMTTLQAIDTTLQQVNNKIDNLQTGTCCEPVWEYWHGELSQGQETLAVPGSGVLHGLWVRNSGSMIADMALIVAVSDGPLSGGGQIGSFAAAAVGQGFALTNHFFELNVSFDNGLYLKGVYNTSEVTLLYRSTN